MSPYTQTPASSAVDMFLLIQQQSYNPLLPCLLQVRVYWFCTNIVGAFKEVYSYIDVQTTSTCWRFDGGASDSSWWPSQHNPRTAVTERHVCVFKIIL